MTVADMNRLEQAARISMGEFQDCEASSAPLAPAPYAVPHLVVLALAAVIVLAVLFH
ncbi:hypothetical protein EN829_024345 [Mesorhizobium sp. M00.F.Ca.ET.186.01.1.1]|nr:hypothetical protein EN848_19410 [bacterium M00.F.Ca.ET.205.01.1.1]TGU51910.1 hypothetical protein EN795_18960 [bacterium M00.F.Ca.ET.152.01.1.1]TGV33307.1 hypothetical protein EN829_024345 [Mesorhizobium sp. M00.F.Ca.ET.186.01.1.1]TGZ42449.1 hypothetical protein EN805_14690 [bacterium M00.F.Ca.ET.162.01.1.1]TIW60232.1 MAG: hypothetical protein E5V48_14575 [Mesorhizobium sp.]